MNVDCAGRKENLVRACGDHSEKRKGLAESAIGLLVETSDIDGPPGASLGPSSRNLPLGVPLALHISLPAPN